jgi:hypothetical protein
MPISKRDNMAWHTSMVQGAIRKLLEDVTEDESFVTVGDSPNHICWQTGHLLFTAAMRLQALGQKADIPHDWVQMFGRGAKHPGDRSAFPTFSELRTTLFAAYTQADKAVAETSDEYLDSEIAIFPTWKDRALHYVTFFLTHDFYHAGQVAIIRRHLGRNGTFG